MSEVMQSAATFFAYALAAIFAENAVFSRALGVSRLVKLVDDASTGSLLFCGLLAAVQLVAAPLGYLVNRYGLANVAWRAPVRPLALVLCAAAALGVVLAVCATLRLAQLASIARVLPMATFNCAVIGCMMVTTIQSFTLGQTMGFALGSSAGYALALAAVTEGQRRLRSRSVPNTFRGLPVTLLYIGILALAIYAFTGHTVAF